MLTFKQFLYESVAYKVSNFRQLKPAPKPDNKKVWDRVKSNLSITGWLFPNGGMTFNRYTSHEDNICTYFSSKSDPGDSVGFFAELLGLAVHVVDDPNEGSLEFRGNAKLKRFALNWANEMGMDDHRHNIFYLITR